MFTVRVAWLLDRNWTKPDYVEQSRSIRSRITTAILVSIIIPTLSRLEIEIYHLAHLSNDVITSYSTTFINASWLIVVAGIGV